MRTFPVSVIIPCFNDGATVGEAVASARAERVAEVVVVNDGSTDPETLSILDVLASEGVTVVHQDNAGLSAARMAGVAATSQPLVLALDADDRLSPGAINALSAELLHDEDLDLAWGDIDRFGPAGPKRYHKVDVLDPWRITYVNEIGPSGGVMIRRTSLMEAGGWSLADAYEDWDLWMAMAERGMRGRHVGRVTLDYRVTGPRMYAAALRRHAELLRILRHRHPALFAARAHNRDMTSAPAPLRAAWSILGSRAIPARVQRYLLMGALVAVSPSRRSTRRP